MPPLTTIASDISIQASLPSSLPSDPSQPAISRRNWISSPLICPVNLRYVIQYFLLSPIILARQPGLSTQTVICFVIKSLSAAKTDIVKTRQSEIIFSRFIFSAHPTNPVGKDKQMLTQKLCCQTIHDCQKVVPLHYESEWQYKHV